MSVNYLWKFYLENDAESFQRLLLEGTLPPAASSASAHRLGGAELGGGDSSSAGGGIFGPSPGAELTETGGGGNQQDNSFKYENSPGVGSYPGTARFYKHMGISTSKVQKEEQITFTRQMLREYDPQGRLLIHLAATEAQGLPFLKALLKHPQIDVNYPDLESGWTSFHRALYHGNISAAKSIYDAEAEKAAIGLGAWPPLLVRSKDKCGEAPFEVFEGSIAGLEGRLKELYHEKEKGGRVDEDLDDSEYEAEDAEKSIKLNTGGDEVFTFGSNKNLTLGFPDEDDRQYPERLPIQRPQDLLRQLSDERFKASGYINSITQFSPTHIQDIQMSKLHTAIITSDPYSNLYICGFGHGGRLGLGNQQLTQFTPRLVPFGDKRYRVVQVALGLDHTVAVLSNGEVWTWGGNKNGQLGYSTKAESQTSQKAPLHTGQSKPKKTISSQSTAEEADYIQPTPRQVIANLKKEFVTGAAASRIHTVLHTRDSLFTFGKNEGQLGIIDSSDARTLAFQTAPRKVAASFLAEKEIVMVAATEKATVILLDNHDVWVLANYGYSRIVFPLGRVARGPSRIRNSTNSPHITKITCGGGTLCALSGMGDVFTVNLGDIGNLRGTSSNGKLAISAPQKVWDLRKKHMAVRDASIGQDGSLIVCTQSGGVWRRVRRAKKDNQTNTSTTTPGNVAPTSGIGLLFTEYKSKDYKFSRVPGLTRIVAVRGNEFGAYAAIRRDCDLMQTMLKVEHPNLWKDIHRLLSFRRAYHLEDGDSSADELSEEDGDVGPGPRSNNTLPTDPAAWFRSPDIEKRMRETLESPEASYNLKNYDMVIKSTRSNIEIPVHKAILSGRSLVLRKKLVEAGANGKATVNGDVTILASDRGDAKAQLIVKDVDILTIANLVYYFYADDLVTLWGRYTRDQNLAQRYRNHRSELATLALILQLKACYNLATGTHLPPTLDKDFKEALLDPDYFTSGDMIIQLAEGTEVQVHSAILRQRSEFFETLYEGASGRWLLYKKEQMEAMQEDAIKVDMKHVKLEVFKLVLAYLYTDKSEDLFDEVKGMETLDHFLDFVMDVLSVANELLLDRLSMTCQKVLGFYVNTRNASQLLTAVAACSVTEFKNVCLQYICLNMETMLENNLLDDLDDDLLEELSRVVKENQRMIYPISRGRKQELELLQKYPTMLEGSAQERRNLIDLYNCASQGLVPHDSTTPSASYKSKSYFQRSSEGNIGLLQLKQSKAKLQKQERRAALQAGGDMIFDMEDENPNFLRKEASDVQATPSRRKSKIYVNLDTSPSSSLPKCGNTWTNVEATNPAIADLSEMFAQAANTGVHPAEAIHISSPPWASPATISTSTKLNMKEIMAQTSTSKHQSGISLGLSAATPAKNAGDKKEEVPATGGVALVPIPKFSQKERKRQQLQQQQAAQSSTPPTTPEKKAQSKTTPWQTPVAGPRVALKDILGPQGQSPSSSGLFTNSPGTASQQAQGSPTIGPRKNIPKTSSPNHKDTVPQSPARPQAPHPSATKTISHTISNSSTTPTSIPPRPRPNALPRAQTTPVKSLPRVDLLPVRPVEPTLQLSLADIISQQQAEQDIIKGHVTKRPLAEIQAEQEFMQWWEDESKRLKEEEEANRLLIESLTGESERGPEKGTRGRGARGRGGGGGRGRGRGGSGSGAGPGGTSTGGHATRGNINANTNPTEEGATPSSNTPNTITPGEKPQQPERASTRRGGGGSSRSSRSKPSFRGRESGPHRGHVLANDPHPLASPQPSHHSIRFAQAQNH